MKETVQEVLISVAIALATVLLIIGLAVVISVGINPGGPANARFGVTSPLIHCSVLMDDATGVYYLFIRDGGGVGVTPLLNPDGTPCRVDNVDPDEVRADVQRNQEQWLEEADK